jgi:predicted  nucleic acid-binding Zn-ribbon protein
MALMFCSNCGSKHEYAGFAPNFCSKCGSPMGGKVSQNVAKKQPQARAVETEQDEDDEHSNVEEVPQLDKLDLEVEIEGSFRAFNLEDLTRNPQNASVKKFASKRVSGIESLSPTKYGKTKTEAQD